MVRGAASEAVQGTGELMEGAGVCAEMINDSFVFQFSYISKCFVKPYVL